MSGAQAASCPNTRVTVKTLIHRSALTKSQPQEILAHPLTPKSSQTQFQTIPQAAKEPKAKVFELLKSSAYKADDEEMPSTPKRIIEALSRAGARKPAKTVAEALLEKNRAAPRKIYVKVVDGKTGAVIRHHMSVYRLMDISSKAKQILEPNPWVGKYKVYGTYNASTMSSMIDAVIHSQPMPIFKTKLVDNLLTYEACLRFGISNNRTELKPLLTAIFTQISTGPIDNKILAFVTYHLGTKDQVFTHMANVMCYQRFKESVPDVRVSEKIVARKPALQKAMAQIDQAHKARREAFKASKQARSEHNGVSEKAGDEKVSALQTVGYMLEAAAFDKKQGPEQKEKLLRLLKNKDKA